MTTEPIIITVYDKTYRATPETNSFTCEGCAFEMRRNQCPQTMDQYDCYGDFTKDGIIWIEIDDPKQPNHDPVNHPSHYTSHPSGIERIQVTEHMTFNCGNAVKYIWRNGLKDGQPDIQDLQKAVWYLNREIERLGGEIMSTISISKENQAYLLSLYSPPFRYDRRGGYIGDANSKMVADNYDPDDAIDLSQNIEPSLRIRGWGYIQYLKHDQLSPAQIQDALGEMMAQALTEYWERNQPPTQQQNDARRDVFYPLDARIIHGDY